MKSFNGRRARHSAPKALERNSNGYLHTKTNSTQPTTQGTSQDPSWNSDATTLGGVQIIDDLAGRTLAAASSKDKEFAGKVGGNSDAATAVGRAVAERAIKAGVGQVVFDRGGYLYHGRVKALAEAARAAGLKF